ncbi:MAG TPA: DUF423 domain-containing protein [Polyangiaceae bacterium]
MASPDVENRRWTTAAALFGASAVLLGAFGSHALRSRVAPAELATWRTAVDFHLLHAVALLALVIPPNDIQRYRWCRRLFAVGITLFSGSLYALVLSGVLQLGLITPFGGLCFTAGWLSLVWAARKR